MRRLFVNFDSAHAAQMARGPFGWVAFAPGAALLLLGVLIWMVPQILVALIAGACMALGGVMLLLAWRLRQRV